MIAENRHTQVMCRIVVVAILLLCALAVMAEDVTFMSNRRHWEKLPTATLMKMGNDFINTKNMPDSALLCYTIIANRYNENLQGEELEQCIRATCYVGTTYRTFFYNQAEAIKLILKAKDLAVKHHYNAFLPVVLEELGNLYWRQSGLQHDTELCKEAIKYHKAAFWKAIETQSYIALPAIIINLNYIAFCENDLSISAKERATYNNLIIPDSTSLKTLADPINQASELYNEGKCEQALCLFRNATIENLKTGPKNKTSLQTMLNGYIYYMELGMGREADALNTLRNTQEMVQVENPIILGGVYSLFAEYYRLQNNQLLADKYELLWWRFTDSIAQLSQAKSVDKAGFLYELDKMNEEHKALVLKQQQDRKMLWVVSGFLALAMVLITLLIINRNRIQQKNRVLYENNVELLAADEQRRKLAELQQRTEAEKYGAIRMDEQSAEELWQNIIHVMEYSPEIYDENFSEPRLAELIEAKQNYVSQAINQQKDWNFSSLVTHYRIREACRRMNDTANYGNYTVEGIGQSVGYSSRSHFVKLFKKQTGLTPSDYMKQCRAGTPPEVLLRPHPLSTSVQSP